jgi:hypothetical protein
MPIELRSMSLSPRGAVVDKCHLWMKRLDCHFLVLRLKWPQRALRKPALCYAVIFQSAFLDPPGCSGARIDRGPKICKRNGLAGNNSGNGIAVIPLCQAFFSRIIFRLTGSNWTSHRFSNSALDSYRQVVTRCKRIGVHFTRSKRQAWDTLDYSDSTQCRRISGMTIECYPRQ